ncbi:hypothetical protein BTR23_18785, partial [Alkalihalophilus pseudofirmus]
MQNTSKLSEEQQTLKWFLGLFYIIFLGYDIFYFYIWSTEPGLSNIGIGYLLHIIMFSLLPISIYLIKKGKSESIKY